MATLTMKGNPTDSVRVCEIVQVPRFPVSKIM